MRRWLANAPIQKKMILSYIVLFAVSLAAFLIILISSFNQDMETEISHMEEANGQLELALDNIIERMESFSFFHFSDTKVRNLILQDDSDIDPEGYEETKRVLESNLGLLADMETYVLRATLLTSDGRVFKNVEEDQTDYIERMKKLAEYTHWERGDDPYICELRKEKINLVNYSVISMISPIWNTVEEAPIGYIFLDLDYTKVEEQWEQTAKIGQETEFMILSRNHILFDSDAEPNGRTADTEVVKIRSVDEGDHMFLIHGESCVVSIKDYLPCGWRLVQYIPFSYFIQRILENMTAFLLILLAVILVTILGIFGFSSQVSHPVQVLSEAMGKVATEADDEEQEIPLFDDPSISQKDEVGKIVQSYNAMAKRINDNIIKTYNYKLRQKQAELKMLQFQINPHFLYNALNTISAIAKLENVDYIPEISSNLSDMFRYNISGDDIVTIKEELEHTLNYMNIQMIRFPNRFQVIREADESLLKCRILKFVFQPIVENCYKYGFKKRKKQDIIWIKVRRMGENVIISIEDNGVGIDPEKTMSLNESLAKGERADSSGRSSGIGLHNVNYRLRNYYGDAYGIFIESEPERFTRISLMIPYSVNVSEENANDESDSSGR